MPTTAELILHTITGLMSLAFLIIVGRYLLWPLFKKQPIAMGIILALCIIAFVSLFIFTG